MEWYHYFSGFWSAMFFANAIPHFVNGISGNGFPTPFAKPSGRGLSSPVINVAWSLFNAVVGYILFRVGKVSYDNPISMLVFFAGISCISLFMAKWFESKYKA